MVRRRSAHCGCELGVEFFQFDKRGPRNVDAGLAGNVAGHRRDLRHAFDGRRVCLASVRPVRRVAGGFLDQYARSDGRVWWASIPLSLACSRRYSALRPASAVLAAEAAFLVTFSARRIVALRSTSAAGALPSPVLDHSLMAAASALSSLERSLSAAAGPLDLGQPGQRSRGSRRIACRRPRRARRWLRRAGAGNGWR